MVHEFAALVGPQFCNWKEREREKEKLKHIIQLSKIEWKTGGKIHTMIATCMNAN